MKCSSIYFLLFLLQVPPYHDYCTPSLLAHGGPTVIALDAEISLLPPGDIVKFDSAGERQAT